MPKYMVRATLKRTFELAIEADDEDTARDDCEDDPTIFEDFGYEQGDDEWFFDIEETDE